MHTHLHLGNQARHRRVPASLHVCLCVHVCMCVYVCVHACRTREARERHMQTHRLSLSHTRTHTDTPADIQTRCKRVCLSVIMCRFHVCVCVCICMSSLQDAGAGSISTALFLAIVFSLIIAVVCGVGVMMLIIYFGLSEWTVYTQTHTPLLSKHRPLQPLLPPPSLLPPTHTRSPAYIRAHTRTHRTNTSSQCVRLQTCSATS